MTCQDCVHYEVCYLIEHYGADIDDCIDCDHFKPKSRFVELPNDEMIIYTNDNWLMLNMESEHLGEAIKRCVDYLTQNAQERG